MKQTGKRLGFLTLALAMTLSMVGCGGSGEIGGSTTTTTDSTTATTTTDGTVATADKMFNVVLTASFTGFDPLRTNDTASTYVNKQIYETLYDLNDEGEVVPYLAESLPTFSEDGLSMTVKLNEGITFHDGTPFNAEAVKYTFELIGDPDFGSARASLAGSIESIDVVDEYTVQFNLLYEDGVMLAKLSHTNAAIVSPTAQASQDLMVAPCGTGPYEFVSSISGSNVVLTRYDDYWGAAPEIKDITMTIITEESTALARMETGEADFMPTLSVESMSRAESMDNVTVASFDSAQIYYVNMRTGSAVNPVMENLEFRTAIAKAIDTAGYVEYILNGNGTDAKSLVGPKVVGYTEAAEDYYIDYDPEGARAILEANGWQDEEILFLVPSTVVYTPMGEYFQANLTAAGFNNVKIETMDWSAWLTESKLENRFDITIAAWSNLTRDGTELLEPNFASGQGTRGKHRDAEFDAYVEASKMTSVTEDRIAALEAANIILMEKAYVKPVFNGDYRCVYNSDLYSNVSIQTGGHFSVCNFTCN